MPLILALLRHGRASGQGPDSTLLPEGKSYLQRLARRLAAEGWTPAVACSSPYRRARETLQVLLAGLGASPGPIESADLTPEADPGEALDTLLSVAPEQGRLLVVTHLPLIARLALELTGDDVDFLPGTLAEIELDETRRAGRILRRIGPDELA